MQPHTAAMRRGWHDIATNQGGADNANPHRSLTTNAQDMGTDVVQQSITYFACVSPHLYAWTSHADCHACNASQTTIKTHISSVALFGPDTDEGQLPTTTTILDNTSSKAHSWLKADPIFDGENAPLSFITLQSQHHTQHATHNKQTADITSTPVSTSTALVDDLFSVRLRRRLTHSPRAC